VSDRDDTAVIGEQQLELWREAVRRAVAYREVVGEDRFFDISFADMQKDPVAVLGNAYDKLGLVMSAEAEHRMVDWRAANPPGAHGTHEFSLGEFGLTPEHVRERFGFYLDRFSLRPT
jgi:hypothetical protein